MGLDYGRPFNSCPGATIDDPYLHSGTVAVCPITGTLSVLMYTTVASSYVYSLIESYDGGRTWEDLAEFYDPDADITSSYGWSSFIMYAPNGDLHAIHYLRDSGYTQGRIRHHKRAVGGTSWSSPVDAITPTGWVNIYNSRYKMAAVDMNADGDIIALYKQEWPTVSPTQNEYWVALYDNSSGTWGDDTQLTDFYVQYGSTEATPYTGVGAAPTVVLLDDRSVHYMEPYSAGAPTYYKHLHYWVKWNVGDYYDTPSEGEMYISQTESYIGYKVGAVKGSSGKVYAAACSFKSPYTSRDILTWEWNTSTEAWNAFETAFVASGTESSSMTEITLLSDGTLRVIASGLYFGAGDGSVFTVWKIEKPSGGSWGSAVVIMPRHDPTTYTTIVDTFRVFSLPFKNSAVPINQIFLLGLDGSNDPRFFREEESLEINTEQAFEYNVDVSEFDDIEMYEDSELLDNETTTKLLDNIPAWATIAYKQLIIKNTTASVINAIGLTVIDSGDIGAVSLASGNVADTISDAVTYEYNESAFTLDVAASGGQGCLWIKWERPSTSSSGANHVEFTVKVA